MRAENGAGDTGPQDDDGRESRRISETEALGAVPLSGRIDRPRLVLSAATVIIGIPGFMAASVEFPSTKTVAFGATPSTIASVIGRLVLARKASRRGAITSTMLLAGTLGLAFTAIYVLIHYREIHETPVCGGSSPNVRKQALALICDPITVGLWFSLLGSGAM